MYLAKPWLASRFLEKLLLRFLRKSRKPFFLGNLFLDLLKIERDYLGMAEI